MNKYTKIEMGVRQLRIFSTDAFKVYRKAILREIGLLPGLIIGLHNLSIILYADVFMLIAIK